MFRKMVIILWFLAVFTLNKPDRRLKVGPANNQNVRSQFMFTVMGCWTLMTSLFWSLLKIVLNPLNLLLKASFVVIGFGLHWSHPTLFLINEGMNHIYFPF